MGLLSVFEHGTDLGATLLYVFCLQVVPGLPFFATRVQLGPEGVAKINGLGPLSDFEKQALDAMVPELKAQIEKGIAFAKA
jgi:malate dehydrogenase